MNISNVNNRANAVSTENTLKEPTEITKETKSRELTAITDQASLSNMLPRLQSLLAVIDRPGDNVLEEISNNITNLQDAFVDSLYSAASAEGVDFGNKLTLRLDENERLAIMGEHPDTERIKGILAERPELSTAFKEISTQSELLRDVSNIGKIIGSRSGLAGYEDTLNRQVPSNYQLSLKGEMSHFYFAKA